MPSTPYAKLQVSLNAGPPQTGAVTAGNGDAVQLTAESTAQWDLTVLPRWEIYAYPPGWTGPGTAGWATESVPQPGGGNADIYVFTGLGPPTAFNLPALPMWGKFLMKLTVSGGLMNGLPSLQLVDDATAIEIVGPNGLRDVAVAEQGQFSVYSWVRGLQESLRLLDAALIGSVTPYLLTPTPIEIGAGSFGGTFQYSLGDHEHPFVPGMPTTIAIGDAAAAGAGTAPAGAAHVHAFPAPTVVADVGINSSALGASTVAAREDHVHSLLTDAPGGINIGDAPFEGAGTKVARHDHVHGLAVPTVVTNVSSGASSLGVSASVAREDHAHQLTFTTLNGILATASAPITVNGQTLTSGGFIGPYFSTNAANPATTGLVRGANGTAGFVFRNVGNVADIVALACDGADQVIVGDATNTQNIVLQTAANTFVHLRADATPMFSAFPSVCAFFSVSPDNAGGTGVIHLADATVEPTAAIADSSLLWAFDGGALKGRSSGRVDAVLVPSLDDGAGTEDLRAPDRKTSRINTNDNSPQTALTYKTETNSVDFFDVVVLAFTHDDNDAAGYHIRAVVKNIAGVASFVGALDILTREDNAGLDATLTVDGAENVLVRVTGVVGSAYKWFVSLKITHMTPAP